MKKGFVFGSLALMCFATAGMAQINPVGSPFTGDKSENWDDPDALGTYNYAGGFASEIFGFQQSARVRTGDGSGGILMTSGWSFNCVIFPRSGGRFIGSATSWVQYEFDPPVAQFGGYFGSNAPNAPSATIEFLDDAGNLLGTDSIPALDCEWRWSGWSSSGTPISFVNVKNDQWTGFVDMDDMEISYGDAPGCYPDCDGDESLTIDDFICFQTLFALGDPYADCDGDSNLTIDDFICFQTLFAIGC